MVAHADPHKSRQDCYDAGGRAAVRERAAADGGIDPGRLLQHARSSACGAAPHCGCAARCAAARAQRLLHVAHGGVRSSSQAAAAPGARDRLVSADVHVSRLTSVTYGAQSSFCDPADIDVWRPGLLHQPCVGSPPLSCIVCPPRSTGHCGVQRSGLTCRCRRCRSWRSCRRSRPRTSSVSRSIAAQRSCSRCGGIICTCI